MSRIFSTIESAVVTVDMTASVDVEGLESSATPVDEAEPESPGDYADGVSP